MKREQAYIQKEMLISARGIATLLDQQVDNLQKIDENPDYQRACIDVKKEIDKHFREITNRIIVCDQIINKPKNRIVGVR